MYDFCFMLKTYNKDIKYVDRLVRTFNQHNIEKIHLYIVAPQKELNFFVGFGNECISVIPEEKINVPFFDEGFNGLSAGYLNQEICKLSFWKLNLCKNYCCIDSECYFISDFRVSDFMHDKDYPYTVLIEDKDLQCDYQYYKYFWQNRQPYLKKIADCIGLKENKILTCHGFQNMSNRVLKSFEINYMNKVGCTYRDLIKISPYEFSWYNLWLIKNKDIPIYMCEPFFKTYHTQKQYWRDVISGVTEKDLARAYVGIVINGNFIPNEELVSYGCLPIRHYIKEEDRLNFIHILLISNLLIWQPILLVKGLWRFITSRIKK